jgi:hypothetical protein
VAQLCEGAIGKPKCWPSDPIPADSAGVASGSHAPARVEFDSPPRQGGPAAKAANTWARRFKRSRYRQTCRPPTRQQLNHLTTESKTPSRLSLLGWRSRKACRDANRYSCGGTPNCSLKRRLKCDVLLNPQEKQMSVIPRCACRGSRRSAAQRSSRRIQIYCEAEPAGSAANARWRLRTDIPQTSAIDSRDNSGSSSRDSMDFLIRARCKSRWAKRGGASNCSRKAAHTISATARRSPVSPA